MTDEPCRPLTPREQQVAELVAAGLTNAQIAVTMAISVRTVDAHLAHIGLKLRSRGVPTRERILLYILAQVCDRQQHKGAA